MNPLIYALPGNESLAAVLVRELGGERGDLVVRRFPDGETYVRLLTTPVARPTLFVCGLDHPNDKVMDLYFAASTAHELGATSVGLVAPYLGYMRQDARFNDGEAITSGRFACWLSQYIDWLATVDPHLHRHPTLASIYSIPAAVTPSAAAISRWILANVDDPLIVGPDGESAQWAQDVAKRVDCPVIVLNKCRHGDRDVEVSLPDTAAWKSRTPVLIDDIISTARTMIAAVAKLGAAGMRPPVCVGVHALFVEDAYDMLMAAGAGKIATCNAVKHPTNAIDVFPDIASTVNRAFAVNWSRK
ncbi:MAG: ribose-phosphate pyrophosphokinase [Rudaea sp.]|nr:ribose-phosphate pyrophosphokinase [Rudaea sp.]